MVPIILFTNDLPKIDKISRFLLFIFSNKFVSRILFKRCGSNKNWKLRIDNIKEMFDHPMIQHAASYVFMREFIERGGRLARFQGV
jgi:hypothetical protein